MRRVRIASASDNGGGNGHGQPVKVMIISMFGPEGQVWLDKLGPWKAIHVAGLSPDYPVVNCNRQEVCVMTTGMGHANAAASLMALTFSDKFDLRRTYFMIAGIAGIDPMQGTIGSAAWAKYLVDFGIQWELDAREKPDSWPSGYLGINTKGPAEKPPLDYKTEVFQAESGFGRCGLCVVEKRDARPIAPKRRPRARSSAMRRRTSRRR